MFKHQGTWYSSFVKVADQPPGGISQNYNVLSVRSGSTGTGGHVSMYLEFQDHRAQDCYATILFDLTAGARGAVPIIRREHAQLWDANGNNVMNKDDLMRGNDTRLLQTHHTSYVIDAEKSKAVIAAVERYRDKSQNGRYIYHPEGGVKSSLSSITRPGVHAVNCADFVIKILREAGITEIRTKMVNTPLRVASPN